MAVRLRLKRMGAKKDLIIALLQQIQELLMMEKLLNN